MKLSHYKINSNRNCIITWHYNILISEFKRWSIIYSMKKCSIVQFSKTFSENRNPSKQRFSFKQFQFVFISILKTHNARGVNKRRFSYLARYEHIILLAIKTFNTIYRHVFHKKHIRFVIFVWPMMRLY